MEGYNFLQNPTSLYVQPQEFTEVDQQPSYAYQLITDYCNLYEETLKVIYEQKIFAYKDFYSHCLYNKEGVAIEKSDFFLIQSFLINKFKIYMTGEIDVLGDKIRTTFNFNEKDLSKQKSIIGTYSAKIKEQGEDYLKDNISDFTDNFSLKKHFSKLEKALNDGKTELDIFKLKFLKEDFKRSNFIMPALKLDYNSFAIKALKGLASLNLVTLIGELIVEAAFNFIKDDVLEDFKKMENFISQLHERDSYFDSIKNNFDNGVIEIFSDLELDLKSIYDEIVKVGDKVEHNLFLYQIELKFGALIEFISDSGLETNIKSKGNHATYNIDNEHKSNRIEDEGYDEFNVLMKEWALFNTGNDYDEAKKTTIYGPEHSDWLFAVDKHHIINKARKEIVEYVETNGMQYEKTEYELEGVANKKWIFLKQLIHEGLKFGIDYNALKRKNFYKSAIEGKMIKDGKNDSWSDDRIREYIIKEVEGRTIYFDEEELFSKKQAKFYFDVCNDSLLNNTKINENKIFQVGMKILDLNDDYTNDLILLDSIEFQIFYYEGADNSEENERVTEWISDL